MSFCILIFISFKKLRDSCEESIIAQIISQHMKDSSTFLISYQIENILTRSIIKPYQIFFEISRIVNVMVHIFHLMIICLIFPVLIFVPEIFGIIGERFVNSQIAPAFRRNQISKPMMEQFVSDGVFPFILIDELSRFLQNITSVKRCCRIFHCSRNIISTRNLCIFCPRVIIA